MYAMNGSFRHDQSSCSAEFSPYQPVNQEITTSSDYWAGINPHASTNSNRCNGGSCRGREAATRRHQKQGVTAFKRKNHIYIERQRRIDMSTLLESLQALLPDPRPRKDRCTLLTEVIDYLRSLEERLKELAIRKAEIMAAQAAPGGVLIIKRNKEAAAAQAADSDAVAAAITVSQQQPCLRNVHVQEITPQQGSTTNPLANYPLMEEVLITFASCSCIEGLWSRILLLFHNHQIDIINATLSTTPDAQMLYYIHARVPKEVGLQSDDLKRILCSLDVQTSQLNAEEASEEPDHEWVELDQL